MAGNVKVGGNVIATHTGVEGAGTVTLSNVTASAIKMSSSGNTITDSAGNAVLSESSGTVNINKGTVGSSVVFPAGHVIQTVMSPQVSAATQSNTDIDVGSYSITTTVANSKIYIMMTLFVNVTAGNGVNNFINLSLLHGSTTLLNGFAIVGAHSSPDMRGVAAWNYLYSPNVAASSTVTFDLKMNANLTTTAVLTTNPSPSHITFMEIAP